MVVCSCEQREVLFTDIYNASAESHAQHIFKRSSKEAYPLCPESQCITSASCFVSIDRDLHENYAIMTYGCLAKDHHEDFYCRARNTNMNPVKCCSGRDYCNDYLKFDNKVIIEIFGPQTAFNLTYLAVASLSIIFLILLCLILNFIRLKNQSKKQENFTEARLLTPSETLPRTEFSTLGTDPRMESFFNLSSGSGLGATILQERTIAKQIRLHENIGQGRYGQVKKGTFHGDPVAVKIFASREEHSWRKESLIYTTYNLNHENILRFIASDMTSCEYSYTQLWLVTEYHENGSLFDFLQRQKIPEVLAKKILITAARGINHLHTSFDVNIDIAKGKSALAHRDIKARNILIKSDFSSCIAETVVYSCMS